MKTALKLHYVQIYMSCSCSNVSDVPSAGLVSDNLCIDRNLTCTNGACNPQTGKCVCPRKMRAIRQEGGGTRCVYSKYNISKHCHSLSKYTDSKKVPSVRPGQVDFPTGQVTFYCHSKLSAN